MESFKSKMFEQRLMKCKTWTLLIVDGYDEMVTLNSHFQEYYSSQKSQCRTIEKCSNKSIEWSLLTS